MCAVVVVFLLVFFFGGGGVGVGGGHFPSCDYCYMSVYFNPIVYCNAH